MKNGGVRLQLVQITGMVPNYFFFMHVYFFNIHLPCLCHSFMQECGAWFLQFNIDCNLTTVKGNINSNVQIHLDYSVALHLKLMRHV